jgi:hypothetical protein
VVDGSPKTDTDGFGSVPATGEMAFIKIDSARQVFD